MGDAEHLTKGTLTMTTTNTQGVRDERPAHPAVAQVRRALAEGRDPYESIPIHGRKAASLALAVSAEPGEGDPRDEAAEVLRAAMATPTGRSVMACLGLSKRAELALEALERLHAVRANNLDAARTAKRYPVRRADGSTVFASVPGAD